MDNKTRGKNLIAKKLRDPDYRKRHDERFDAFRLEAQILSILEKKGWTYSDLAKATGTTKGNVSRDLKAGGITNAKLSRIIKMANALGYKYLSLLLPQDRAKILSEMIEKVMTGGSAIVEPAGERINLMEASVATNVIYSEKSETPDLIFKYADQTGTE